jgi:hypothetical protein
VEWLTKIAPGYGPDGSPLLSVLCKQTYVFAHEKGCEPDTQEQIPFHDTDAFLDDGDPLADATKQESDLVAYKPLTDVILHASAHAPKGKLATYLDVGIMIGNYRKLARVFGDRKVIVSGTGFAFSEAEPFASLRLDYKKAYGGKDAKSTPGVEYAYPRNPIGKGFIIRGDAANLQGTALPNIEDPQNLLTPAKLVLGKFDQWQKQPEPVAFGYVPRNSHPRLSQAGLNKPEQVDAEAGRQAKLETMPEVGSNGQAQPAAPMPLMNPEFFNGAPAGLKLPYLKGDELIKLRFLDAAIPAFQFQLSLVKPKLFLDVGTGRQDLPAVLQTLEIFKETNQVSVVWRGSARYAGPDSLRKFKKFDFGVAV